MAQTEQTIARLEREEAAQLRARLAGHGILAIYGGGSGLLQKGHGFWLYRAGPEALARYKATNGWTHLDDVTVITNDGVRSGNPYFWMFDDAVKLLAQEIEKEKTK